MPPFFVFRHRPIGFMLLLPLLSLRSCSSCYCSSRWTGVAFRQVQPSSWQQQNHGFPVISTTKRRFHHRHHHAQDRRRRRPTFLTLSPKDFLVNSLLPMAMDRAKRTLTTTTTATTTTIATPVNHNQDNTAKEEDASKNESTVDENAQQLRSEVVSSMNQLLDVVKSQQQQQRQQASQPPKPLQLPLPPTPPALPNPETLSYSENPAISLTALAHSLWAHTILPHADIAIDATCGNGHDSVALARLLFAKPQPSSLASSTNTDSTHHHHAARLLCLDIQPQACVQTQHKLSQEVDEATLTHKVTVLNTSHEKLADIVSSWWQPEDASSSPSPPSIGLIAYNLGYLPGQSDKTSHVTQLESTLASLTDAIQLLRVGGMISVMTYSSNPLEQEAVIVLLEAMALLSVKNRSQLLQELFTIPPTTTEKDDEEQNTTRLERRRMMSLVQTAFGSVMKDHSKSCWRVIQHRSMGRPQSPMLTTATRIR